MQLPFEIAVGTVTGRQHQQVGKNNQDAYFVVQDTARSVAVVCDGCGSGAHSEVGAQLGARWVGQAIAAELRNASVSDRFSEAFSERWFDAIRLTVAGRLSEIAATLQGDASLSQVLHDYFLFTIVGAIVTEREAIAFTLGDGVVGMNGKLTAIDYPNNAPPYLAYGLLPHLSAPRFEIRDRLPIAKVESILIGTDGVVDLMEAKEKRMPGKAELVGGIAQFWQDDRYFQNPDAVRRKLSLVAREVTKYDRERQVLGKEGGLLRDDTTLAVLRRRR